MKKANGEELNGNQVKDMLNEAWNDFIKYYDEWAPRYYTLLQKTNEKKPEDEHWICWNEDDLMLHLGRFFYGRLGENSSIEVHLNKNLTKSNFKGYDFVNSIPKLCELPGVKKRVKLDLIIAYEDHKSQFLLCAEAKCFHASEESVSRGERTAEGVIEEDIARLVALKDLKIAEEVVFILFDDFIIQKIPKNIR